MIENDNYIAAFFTGIVIGLVLGAVIATMVLDRIIIGVY